MKFDLKRAIYVALAAALFDSATSAVIAFGSSPSAPFYVVLGSPSDHDGDKHDRAERGDKGKGYQGKSLVS